MREIRRRLSWVGFLEPLSEEELDALVRSVRYVRLEEGEVLVVGPEEQAERMLLPVGGPVHGAGFGLLVGSLGLAGLRTGELPVPLVITSLASAAAGLLSPLYFVWEPAAWLIPAGRFPGLVVSAIAGARLSRR